MRAARSTASAALVLSAVALVFPATAPPAAGQELTTLVGTETSELAAVVERYRTDRTALGRRWNVPYSSDRNQRFRDFFSDWRQQVEALDFESLTLEGRVDYALLINDLTYQLDLIEREARLAAEMNGFIPFTSLIVELEERRRRREPVESEAAATRLADLPAEIRTARAAVEARLEDGSDVSRIVALRAVTTLAGHTRLLEDWYEHYAGYDHRLHLVERGSVTPARKAALDGYEDLLARDGHRLPRGRGRADRRRPDRGRGLPADLAHEMIPYTPEELHRDPPRRE